MEADSERQQRRRLGDEQARRGSSVAACVRERVLDVVCAEDLRGIAPMLRLSHDTQIRSSVHGLR